MVPLAEIADKMPNIAEIWLSFGSLSLPFLAIAAIHRWSALAVMPFAAAFSVSLAFDAYHEAHVGPFNDAIRQELGGAWVATSFASALLPTGLVGLVAALKWSRTSTSDSNEPA